MRPDGRDLELNLQLNAPVGGQPRVDPTSQAGLFPLVHRLDRITEGRPGLLLDLDEDEAAPTAHDQVELDTTGTDVSAEDAVSAQPVMPGGPALRGPAASGGATPRPRRRAAQAHNSAPRRSGGGCRKGHVPGRQPSDAE